jgi:hypothetical protein
MLRHKPKITVDFNKLNTILSIFKFDISWLQPFI